MLDLHLLFHFGRTLALQADTALQWLLCMGPSRHHSHTATKRVKLCYSNHIIELPDLDIISDSIKDDPCGCVVGRGLGFQDNLKFFPIEVNFISIRIEGLADGDWFVDPEKDVHLCCNDLKRIYTQWRGATCALLLPNTPHGVKRKDLEKAVRRGRVVADRARARISRKASYAFDVRTVKRRRDRREFH